MEMRLSQEYWGNDDISVLYCHYNSVKINEGYVNINLFENGNMNGPENRNKL